MVTIRIRKILMLLIILNKLEIWFHHRIMCPTDADRKANSVGPHQTALICPALILVYTVWPDVAVWKIRIWQYKVTSHSEHLSTSLATHCSSFQPPRPEDHFLSPPNWSRLLPVLTAPSGFASLGYARAPGWPALKWLENLWPWILLDLGYHLREWNR